LWITTTEFMDAKTQELLVGYVNAGGHLIIYPAIPILDLYLNPCTIIRDGFDIRFSKLSSPNKVEAFGIQDIFTIFKEKIIFESTKQNVVSKTEKGEACGIHKKIGNGKVTALGFAFGYTADEHLHLIENIIALDKIKKQAMVTDPDIQFVLRKGKKYSYLFLLNYHNQKKSFKVESQQVTMKPFSSKVIKKKT